MLSKRIKTSAHQQEGEETEYEFKINLIEVIQIYPKIYDIQPPGHKKDYIHNEAWQKVAVAMNAPGEKKQLNFLHYNCTTTK